MSSYIFLQVGDEIESCLDCLLNTELVQSTEAAYPVQLLICNRYPEVTTCSLSFGFVNLWQLQTLGGTHLKSLF